MRVYNLQQQYRYYMVYIDLQSEHSTSFLKFNHRYAWCAIFIDTCIRTIYRNVKTDIFAGRKFRNIYLKSIFSKSKYRDVVARQHIIDLLLFILWMKFPRPHHELTRMSSPRKLPAIRSCLYKPPRDTGLRSPIHRNNNLAA